MKTSILLDEYANIIPNIEETVVLLSSLRGSDGVPLLIQHWIQKCDDILSSFNNIQRKICISTAQQQRCLSINKQILCLRVHFGALLVQGDGVSERDPLTNRVRWVDCDAAFERRLQIEVIVNVFENFREQCLKAYGLDPAHYYTTPGLTWDVMLKYTKIKLELLTDINKLMFIELGIRGGASQCSNRYAKANNPYMAVYNENEEIIYLVYFDANNLYGWAMAQWLPHGGFKWVPNVYINFNVHDDYPVGYILEVDLEYPKELHDAHNDLAFCPERSKLPGSKEKKLLTSLLPKRKHVLHYRALKQALANGLKLVKIHRILKFNQSPWLKSYIDFNTSMRAKSRNEFEKNLFKLMNNMVYGKTMENVRKHVDVQLVTK